MNTYESLMKKINPEHMPTDEQKEVITSRDPALIVVAGAGSGKTRTMANRIAYWVGCGNIAPSEVLGLTFTRKAAGELEERVEKSLAAIDALIPRGDQNDSAGVSVIERPTIATYNSFASDIATSYSPLIGIDSGARLMGEAERYQCMAQIVRNLDFSLVQQLTSTRSSVIKNALALASALTDNDVSLDKARSFFEQSALTIERINANAPKRTKWGEEKHLSKIWNRIRNSSEKLRESMVLLDIVEKYWQYKKDEGLIEFADQIAYAVKILEKYPSLGQELSARYRLVLLDEYQDTSVSQARMLGAALGYSGKDIGEAGMWRSVSAVGDPNQAIYGWRGASANSFAEFSHVFRSLGKAQDFSLTTTFRNDKAILDAANIVASGIDNDTVTVKELAPRQGAGVGRVVEIRPLRRADSYRAMALRIRDKIAEIRAGEEEKVAQNPVYQPRLPEIAVLCRKRRYIALVTEELQKLGIPYEVVGGQSLLERPEIITIRSALHVVSSPHRGDSLARLCSYLNIGVADMRALQQLSKRIAHEECDGEGKESGLDAREERSLIEALDSLDTHDVPELSAQGYERLTWLARVLRSLRSRSDVPLGDLIHNTARLLGITVSAFSRTDNSQRVVTSINSFAQLAYDYSSTRTQPSLEDFLEWLDAVDSEEHGGEGQAGDDDTRYLPDEDVTVNPGVVQIMTVHASKGLEWKDLVAIPEMVEGEFSDITSRAKVWLTNSNVYPYPLRSDYVYLPQFSVTSIAPEEENSHMGLSREFYTFEEEEYKYESQEARRLAYVAFTRVTDELLLVGYGLNTPLTPTEREKDIKKRSVFMKGIDTQKIGDISYEAWVKECGEEFARRLVYDCPEGISFEERDAFLNEDEYVKEIPDIPDYSQETDMRYPHDVPRSLGAPMIVDTDYAMTMLDDLAYEGELLLVEQRERGQKSNVQLMRPYLTATDVVSLAQNPGEFFAQHIRPVPHEPSRRSRIGTEVHKRIAQSYLLAPILDLDAERVSDVRPPHDAIEKLFRAYEQSRWSHYEPIAIEAPVSIVIAGEVIRCTIDAVLDTSTASDLCDITIVDWKTGAIPTRAIMESRRLQLAVYRLAYAQVSGVPVENISAVFVYLDTDGRVVEIPAPDMSKEEIEEIITRYSYAQ